MRSVICLNKSLTVFFSQLDQSSSLSAEEIDYNKLQERLSVMDNSFSVGKVNTAIQEAHALLFLFQKAAKQDDVNRNLLQVSKVD